MFKNIMIIMLTMVLTENYVLVRFLGICPFLGVSKNLNSAVGMSTAVIFVMTLASGITSLMHTYLLRTLNIEYFTTIVFILVIATLVQLVEVILKKYMKSLYKALGVYLPLITTNCAVLGVTLLNIDNSYNLLESMANGFGAGVGFLVAMVMFSGVRRTLERAEPPKCFEGLPITLIAASLTALTFTGFTGIVENLFS